MPTLDPMLRERLYRPVPSARCSGGSVANVTVVSGTNRNPSPAPWMNPVTAIVHCETFGFHPVMSYMAQAVSSRPVMSSSLISIRPISRPTRNMQSIVPSPRGPMTIPADHGITHQGLQIGGQQRQGREVGYPDD